MTIKFNVNTFFKTSETSINSYEDEIVKNSNQAIIQQILKYQQHIKFINFAVVIIKSNIAFAIFKLSEFLINSSLQHIDAVDKMFKYLIHIKDYEIIFNAQTINSNCIFFKSLNASFANDLKTRYNSQKYCFKLFDEMIDWKTNK